MPVKEDTKPGLARCTDYFGNSAKTQTLALPPHQDSNLRMSLRSSGLSSVQPGLKAVALQFHHSEFTSQKGIIHLLFKMTRS